MSDIPLPTEPFFDINQLEQITRLVESEFLVEEKLVERGIPTFYVKLEESTVPSTRRVMAGDAYLTEVAIYTVLVVLGIVGALIQTMWWLFPSSIFLLLIVITIIEQNLRKEAPMRRSDSKAAFLRLVRKLDELKFMPLLRRTDGRPVLRVVPKPASGKNRPIINIILLLATIGTTLLTGYFLALGLPEQIPNPYVGAAEFTVAILAILGAHEMGHKLTANKHGVEATYPYFIPGLPPIGTFGAVIQQKSLSPNKDALFDLGASGPVIGFIVAMVVTAIGVAFSPVVAESQLPPNTAPLSVPLLFDFLVAALAKWPNTSGNFFLLLHPVAFAGWVGMIVTTLNLLPTGTLDGGHTVRSLLGEKARLVLTFFSLAVLFFLGYWFMLILVLFLMFYRHPGPMDDVSKLSTKRKIFALVLVAIFVLCLTPLAPIL